ncbi:MAG: hypothetical protein WAU88_08320 [Candidatus Zixiibacteriota bacterium]
MELANSRNRQIVWIGVIVLGITLGHYLTSVHFGIAHNILQRLYYVPIIWAAYRFGRRGGVWVSAVSSLLYLPHILITWRMHPEYQVNQILEILLFLIFGFAFGLLFERKANDQRLLQSYEKLALFGSLSRSVIRSLKAPVKSLQGMLMMMEPLAKRDPAIESCLTVMRGQTDTIAGIRNNLIALVERKKLRLKRHGLNVLAAGFISEIELSLRLKEIRLAQKLSPNQVFAQVNEPTIIEALHHLVGIMVDNLTPAQEVTIHTGESATHVWLGVSTQDVRLNSYYLSDLSCLNLDNWGDHNLIDIINTMNNHFGDLRFRWTDGNLIEFILVFPKHLRLPWYLKDEPANPVRPTPDADDQPMLGNGAHSEQRQQPSGSFFAD